MKVQILGTGCSKCLKLAENAKEAAKKLNIACEIVKIESIDEITKMGVMLTPALAIDDKVVSSGKVLSVDELEKILSGDTANVTAAATEKCGEGSSCSQEGAAPKQGESCCSGGAKSSPAKRVFTAILLLFVLGSIGFMLYKELGGANSSSDVVVAPQSEEILAVYYFHGTKRCMTCNRIEALTNQAIEAKYASNLADGSIKIIPVNVQIPENNHFIKDFNLNTNSVVMQKNGKYERFDNVWSLVGNQPAFFAYIQDGIARNL